VAERTGEVAGPWGGVRAGDGTVGWRPRGPAVREAVLRRRRPGRRRRGRL